jgi:ABC-type branched-subunit amino acid transport system substrate-binding protein
MYAAFGYDAGVAVISALSSGATSRDALRKALSSFATFPGATGPFAFDAEGEYRVEPVFITVKGSEFKLLKDSGQYRGY